MLDLLILVFDKFLLSFDVFRDFLVQQVQGRLLVVAYGLQLVDESTNGVWFLNVYLVPYALIFQVLQLSLSFFNFSNLVRELKTCWSLRHVQI